MKKKKADMMGKIEEMINDMLDIEKSKEMTPEDFLKKRDTVKIALEYQKIKNGIDEGREAGAMFEDPEAEGF